MSASRTARLVRNADFAQSFSFEFFFRGHLALRVQSRMDSRIVLDQNGADLLLGHGDMLFLPPGASKPLRAQGTFIDDKEIRDSVKAVRAMAEAQYEPELVQIKSAMNPDDMEKDELFDDAVRVVLETRRGSVSLLQRRLTIGYSRASRLIEQASDVRRARKRSLRSSVGPLRVRRAVDQQF